MSEGRSASVGKRYELLGELGRGGMGAVYLVRDRLRNRRVALKRVLLARAKESAAELTALPHASVEPTLADIAGLPTLGTAPGQQQESSVVVLNRGHMSRDRLQALRLALANEFRLLAALRHPSIVSVLDYGFAPDGQPYFTMELLEGAQSLAAASHGASLPDKVGLLLQILAALSYLHRRGVLHRDLKPANIRCVNTAAGLRVKLLDFGLAVLYGRHFPESLEISGTIGYIAPEVLQGQAITPQADLYSFGVVAFELLTGRPLCASESVTTLVTATLSREPSFAEEVTPARRAAGAGARRWRLGAVLAGAQRRHH